MLSINEGHQLLQEVVVDLVLIQAGQVALRGGAVLCVVIRAEVGVQRRNQGVGCVVSPAALTAISPVSEVQPLGSAQQQWTASGSI